MSEKSASAPDSDTSSTRNHSRWRWLWWAGGVLLVLAAGITIVLVQLDDWLKNALEKQVAEKTNGRYRLDVRDLHTDFGDRTLTISGIHLRPTKVDTTKPGPWLKLDVGRLRIADIGLGALLRRGVVPIDTFLIDSVRVQVLNTPNILDGNGGFGNGKPLHEQLPLSLDGVHIAHLTVRDVRAQSGPDEHPYLRLKQGNLKARDVLISREGAADDHRLGYAQAVALRVSDLQALVPGHAVSLGAARFLYQKQLLQLDSLRVRPLPPDSLPQAGSPDRIALWLPRLSLTGLQTAELQHRRLLADTLRIVAPDLTYTTPKLPETDAGKPLHEQLAPYLGHVLLKQVRLERAKLHLKAGNQEPRVQSLTASASDIQIDTAGFQDPKRLFYATAYTAQARALHVPAAGHQLDVAGLRLASDRGLLRVDTLDIKPAGGLAKGAAQVTMHVPRGTLSGWTLPELKNKRLDADTLRAVNMTFRLQAPATPPPPLHEAVRPFLDYLRLGYFQLQNSDVRVTAVSFQPVVQHVYLTGHDVRLTATALNDPKRTFYARRWDLRTGAASARLDVPFYRLRYQRLEASTAGGTLTARDISLKPTMSQPQQSVRKGHQAGQVILDLPRLTGQGIDFGALFRERAFLMRSATASGATIRIVDGGDYPINPKISVVTPESIGDLDFRVDVRKIDIKSANLYVRYLSPLTDRVGTLNITRINGTLTNISNDPRHMSPAHPAEVQATGYLAGECYTKAHLWLPLRSNTGAHRLTATFGAAPFSIINSITEPLRMMRFKSGQVQRIDVDMQANKQRITGTMRARYTDLHITFLRTKDGESDKTILTRVATGLANLLIIRGDNPRDTGKLKVGDVQSDRDRRYSVFALWRQGIVSGLLNSIGAPDKVAEELSEP